jgi:hypothetical protein
MFLLGTAPKTSSPIPSKLEMYHCPNLPPAKPKLISLPPVSDWDTGKTLGCVCDCNIPDVRNDDQMISLLMAGTGWLFYSQYCSSLGGPIPYQNNTSSSVYVALVLSWNHKPSHSACKQRRTL